MNFKTVLSFLFLIQLNTLASEDLFSAPNSIEADEFTEVNSEVTHNKINSFTEGVFDGRLIYTGKAVGHTDRGRGLSTYGAHANKNGSNQRDRSIKLSRIAIAHNLEVENINFQCDIQIDNNPSQSGQIGLIEAFIAWDKMVSKNLSYSFRLGQLIPPISLEHSGAAWSTEYSLTPSAINSWVGEEVRPIALEFNTRYFIKDLYPIQLTLAPFSNNDTSGSILAWRGWSLNDQVFRTGRVLPTQTILKKLSPDDNRVDPFKEIDGRPGCYLALKGVFFNQLQLQYFYSDSFSAENIVDESNEYSWDTHFSQFSLKWDVPKLKGLTVMFQTLYGNTWMGRNQARGVDTDFNAHYALLSYEHKTKHRFTARYDKFKVIDLDNIPDKNDSKGNAWTLAYIHTLSPSHQLSFEWIKIDSERDGNDNFGTGDPNDDLIQLNYRFQFSHSSTQF